MKGYSIKRSISKEISEVVNLFLEDAIQEFEIKLYAVIHKEEFNELIGRYDSNNGVIFNGVTVDEYSYDIGKNIIKKILIEYIPQGEEEYIILSIQGFTDFVS